MASKINATVQGPSLVVELVASVQAEADGKVTLRLDGVFMAQPDWQEAEALLQRAGIGKEDAFYLADQFARRSEEFLLARVLADRMTRIG